MDEAASRYQVLHNEDDASEASTSGGGGGGQPQPSTSAQAGAVQEPAMGEEPEAPPEAPPPPYTSIALKATAAPEGSSQGDFPVPPPYSVATSLPTYDEAENAKVAAMVPSGFDLVDTFSAMNGMPWDENSTPQDFSEADQLKVGNDGIFMLAFFMAFLFNWLGFCLFYCLTNTIAGHYGAICGFGLSLIKWILIVRFSGYYFNGYFYEQYWLWWIFLVLGLLLFFRGLVNYLKVRNCVSTAHRTSFFFFY